MAVRHKSTHRFNRIITEKIKPFQRFQLKIYDLLDRRSSFEKLVNSKGFKVCRLTFHSPPYTFAPVLSITMYLPGLSLPYKLMGFEPWQTNISLNFLSKGKNEKATIDEDDGKEGISKRIIRVKGSDVLPISLAEKSSNAIIKQSG